MFFLVSNVFSWSLFKYDRDVLSNLSVFLSSELDEEAKALQALLSTVGKPVVSIHFSRRLFFPSDYHSAHVLNVTISALFMKAEGDANVLRH